MPSQTKSLDTAALLGDLRGVFASGRTRELVWRLDQLRGIERLCDDPAKGLDIGIVGDAETLPDAWDLIDDFRHELAELTAAV